MVVITDIAKIIYEEQPTKYHDRVDGLCNMFWQEAHLLLTQEALKSIELATKIATHLDDLPNEADNLWHKLNPESMGR